jgi:hypothetical protein
MGGEHGEDGIRKTVQKEGQKVKGIHVGEGT